MAIDPVVILWFCFSIAAFVIAAYVAWEAGADARAFEASGELNGRRIVAEGKYIFALTVALLAVTFIAIGLSAVVLQSRIVFRLLMLWAAINLFVVAFGLWYKRWSVMNYVRQALRRGLEGGQ